MEERKEFMVSPKGGRPTLRNAHFLSPSISSINGPVFYLPSDAFSPINGDNDHLGVQFRGWKRPLKDWKKWVDHMHSLHQSLRKKVGIFHAIMNSTYVIHRNDDLIHGFASRWCCETNTFVFPWGEATLTLEDMIVLGGYSVLGDPVFSPIESGELKEKENKLLSARTEIYKSTNGKKAIQSLWLSKFMDSGSEIEHQSFLALWLSRFVFPKASDNSIVKCVIPIAVHLAKGTKIALVPSVLYSIYMNLSDLRKALVASTRLGSSSKQNEYILEVTISAPFQLVQIWVWERFLKLQPKPVILGDDEPRFAKWQNLRKNDDIGNVKLAIEEAANHFQWRPYQQYKEKEEYIWVASDIYINDEEVDVLIRCLRVSELAGMDSCSIAQYLPHRVALQFGIDQDLPGHVARENVDQMMAWKNYNRPVRDQRLYVPSCLFKSDVTSRYLEWWKKLMSTQDGHTKAFVERVNSRNVKMKMLLNNVAEKKSENDALASPSLPTNCNAAVAGKGSGNKNYLANGVLYKNFIRKNCRKVAGKKEDVDPLVNPGLLSKCRTVNAVSSDDQDLGRTVENEHKKEGMDQSKDPAINNGARVDLMDGSGFSMQC